jgi:hypothetical protein
MRKGGVNLPRDAAVGEQFWRAEVVRDAPPPLRKTDVTEGGMGGGGAIALLVPFRPPLLMDYVMCSGKKYLFVIDLT